MLGGLGWPAGPPASPPHRWAPLAARCRTRTGANHSTVRARRGGGSLQEVPAWKHEQKQAQAGDSNSRSREQSRMARAPGRRRRAPSGGTAGRRRRRAGLRGTGHGFGLAGEPGWAAADAHANRPPGHAQTLMVPSTEEVSRHSPLGCTAREHTVSPWACRGGGAGGQRRPASGQEGSCRRLPREAASACERLRVPAASPPAGRAPAGNCPPAGPTWNAATCSASTSSQNSTRPSSAGSHKREEAEAVEAGSEPRCSAAAPGRVRRLGWGLGAANAVGSLAGRPARTRGADDVGVRGHEAGVHLEGGVLVACTPGQPGGAAGDAPCACRSSGALRGRSQAASRRGLSAAAVPSAND